MKGRNIALLRVQPVDYRSLPLLLEQREEAGWKLEKILWPWIGVFRPAEGEQSRYTADLIPENALRDAQKKKEYVQLCADELPHLVRTVQKRPLVGKILSI